MPRTRFHAHLPWVAQLAIISTKVRGINIQMGHLEMLNDQLKILSNYAQKKKKKKSAMKTNVYANDIGY